MSDRQMVYPGQIPQDLDILYTNLHPYIGQAKLAAALLGTGTQANGLACTPTTPSASLQVNIGPGEIYALEAIDTTAYGSLEPNANLILKQGINISTTLLPTMAAPLTVGYSINYLVEATFTESDGGSTVLPYYNSTNPSQTFAGPNNDDANQNTVRQDRVTLTVKAGTAATTGTQTTPSPDANNIGLWVVTVAQGQTTITSGNISLYSGAPFISPSSSGLVPAIQNSSYIYGADSSSSANTVTVTLVPAIAAYQAGQLFLVKIANTNTGAATINVNGLGAKNIQRVGGAALIGSELVANRIAVLIYDGTQFEVIDPAENKFQFVTDSGSANAYVATLIPAPTAYYAGLTLILKIANTNTSGTCTLNVNSLGTKNIKLPNGNSLDINNLYAGQEALLVYDGTQFQLLNPTTMASQAGIQNAAYTYVADTGSANAYAVSLTPAPAAYVAGMMVQAKITNSNTGASTINVNSLGTKNIKLMNGGNPDPNDLLAGMISYLQYDGTQFQLLNPNAVVKRINVQTFSSSGSYTPSTGLIGSNFEIIGGGGGSGGVASGSGATLSVAAGGGGSSPIAARYFTAAQIGSSATITIGAGGTAGAAGANNGGTGGTSSAALAGTGTITISSTGGVGGNGGSTGVTGTQANAGGVGGSTSNSEKSNIGGSGLNGFYIQQSGPFAISGKGADSVWGQGGLPQIVTNGSGSGNPGLGYGAGASGAAAAQAGSTSIAGSAGSGGFIKVTEYLTQ